MSELQEKKTSLILVIDDDEAITGVVSTVLSADGHRVLTASDGTTGLELAKKEPPNLILMDIGLPEMDGYEVTRKLKEHTRLQSVPIIFLTGKNASEDGGRAFGGGGAVYIQKPFSNQQLKDLVTLALQSV
jgi:CheY-like chemotaxis protein